MRSEPRDLQWKQIADVLRMGWSIDAVAGTYVAVGGGSHHWRVEDVNCGLHWVTVDDLTYRPSLRNNPVAVLSALEQALAAAAALPSSDGIDFVVAPELTVDGQPLRSVVSHYALSVYPYLDGTSLEWGRDLGVSTAVELAGMLARLHKIADPLRFALQRQFADLPGRQDLELALSELEHTWSGGPFTEAARSAIARNEAGIRELLHAFDGLREVTSRDLTAVVTHGEPHPGNLISFEGRLLLIDWDTVAADAPERDLWWLDDQPAALARWEDETGWKVDERRLRLYRLRWKLDDIASFVHMLRSPHVRDEDTERWLGFGERLLE